MRKWIILFSTICLALIGITANQMGKAGELAYNEGPGPMVITSATVAVEPGPGPMSVQHDAFATSAQNSIDA